MSAHIAWQKSSFSESEGSCVELAWHEGAIVMREGDIPELIIRMAPDRIRTLLAAVKELRLTS
ncbi:DUF397 domain-containing protein [Streptomyces sp. NPDC049577]|uniref:DUF397 domain-containing protein n=1 Tax=Streptomyces sp. NPDC049577 TaxID=3155153 RepID=UPI003412C07B